MKGPPSEDSLNSAGCPSGLRDVDYSEYVWMGEEMEEFDSKCIQEFCEEEFIESCFEDLFEEERHFAEELEIYLRNLSADQMGVLFDQMDSLALSGPDAQNNNQSEFLSSRLNPNAPEFVPRITALEERVSNGNAESDYHHHYYP